jgi:group I intron endonuclease
MLRGHLLSNPRFAGAVRRYHTWPTLQQQTVADHTFHVIRIYDALWGPIPANVTRALIWHDAGELAVGDLPFPVKARNPQLKQIVDSLEAEAVTAFGVKLSPLDPEQKARLRVADLLEMTEFGAVELAMGNRFASPILNDTAFSALSIAALFNEEAVLQVKAFLRKVERNFEVSIERCISGVYVIVNVLSGRRYVGSSEDVLGRWYGHLRALRRGKHSNRYLQNSWKSHTPFDFSLGLLEAVEDEGRLLSREQHWLDHYKQTGAVYNVALSTSSPMKGRKHAEETLVVLRENAIRLNQDPVFRAQRALRSAGENNPMFGRTHTSEARASIGRAQKDREVSPTVRAGRSARMKGNQYRKGKFHRLETRQQMSISQKRAGADPVLRQKRSARMKGPNHPNYGKHPPKETRAKMSKSAKARKPRTRDKSGRYSSSDDET